MHNITGTIPARDGIELAFDCWLPDGASAGAPVPALVTRTPYGRKRYADGPWMRLVEAGYAHVGVDVRGRGDSGGTFEPFVNDGYDGYDVVEWIAAQDWCTGVVGGIGGSYDAATQYWAARHEPPSLKCIVPIAVSPQLGPSGTIAFSNGVPMPYWIWWYSSLAGMDSEKLDWDAILAVEPADMVKAAGVPELYQKPWDDYLSGKEGYGEPAWTVDPAEIKIPAFVVNGLWDDPKTFEWWEQISASPAFPSHRLLAGAWDHAGNAAPRETLGGVDVRAAILDPFPLWLEFLDAYLRDKAPQSTPPAITIARTGDWGWETHDSWPLPTTRVTHELGSASWKHDPTTPLRVGGDSKLSAADAPLDASLLCDRDDVVSFDLPTAVADENYSGQAVVTMTVEQEHPGMLAVWLSDIAADGAGVRLGFWLTPQAHPGGGAHTFEVNMPHMHHRVKAGGNLRVSFGSSFAPVFAHGLVAEQITLVSSSISVPLED